MIYNLRFKGNLFFLVPPPPHSEGQRRFFSQYFFNLFSAGEITLKFPKYQFQKLLITLDLRLLDAF